MKKKRVHTDGVKKALGVLKGLKKRPVGWGKKIVRFQVRMGATNPVLLTRALINFCLQPRLLYFSTVHVARKKRIGSLAEYWRKIFFLGKWGLDCCCFEWKRKTRVGWKNCFFWKKSESLIEKRSSICWKKTKKRVWFGPFHEWCALLPNSPLAPCLSPSWIVSYDPRVQTQNLIFGGEL